MAAMNYWLMKSEPGSYGIDDLKRDKRTGWTGVRNHQARNFMRDAMKPGDLVFFYHSNAEPTGIAGVARVAGEPSPDPTQFDKNSEFYDPASKPGNLRWIMANIEFAEKFPRVITLEELRGVKGLEKMALLQRGQRLSVQPVSAAEWDIITSLVVAKKK